MLTKAEMDERLAALKPEHGFSRTTEWSLVDREREALETAKQLAEWLQRLCAFWYLGGPLMDLPLEDVDKFYEQIQAWLEDCDE